MAFNINLFQPVKKFTGVVMRGIELYAYKLKGWRRGLGGANVEKFVLIVNCIMGKSYSLMKIPIYHG